MKKYIPGLLFTKRSVRKTHQLLPTDLSHWICTRKNTPALARPFPLLLVPQQRLKKKISAENNQQIYHSFPAGKEWCHNYSSLFRVWIFFHCMISTKAILGGNPGCAGGFPPRWVQFHPLDWSHLTSRTRGTGGHRLVKATGSPPSLHGNP